MKPVIGITCYDIESENLHRINKSYIKAVKDCGGIPIIIPTIEDEKDYDTYLNIIDGLILTGGEDVFPPIYGEDPLNTTKYISIKRDKYEIELFKRAYDKNMSILGICRGLQVINVALGGSLYQDIPRQIEDPIGHLCDRSGLHSFYHKLKLEDGTTMKEIFKKDEIFVNSYHHQGVKELGKGLIASSSTEDGLVESIEAMNKRFLLGVQFHPELLYKEHPEYLNIFKVFLDSI